MAWQCLHEEIHAEFSGREVFELQRGAYRVRVRKGERPRQKTDEEIVATRRARWRRHKKTKATIRAGNVAYAAKMKAAGYRKSNGKWVTA